MRPEIDEIISGWMLVDDFDDLSYRIEAVGAWMKTNGVTLEQLEPDEYAHLTMMVESQIARGIVRGDFDFIFGCPG